MKRTHTRKPTLFLGKKSFKNLVQVLNGVYLKLLDNTKKEDESRSTYGDFQSSFKKFCHYGKTCFEDQMKENEITLNVPEIDYTKSPKYYASISKVMNLGKQLVENAINIIRENLEETRSKNRVLNGKEGPLSEIRYWSSIATKFGKLYDQLGSLSKTKRKGESDFGKIDSGVHRDRRIQFIREMVEHDSQFQTFLDIFDSQYQELSKILVKARDNVKFLETLNRHFKTIDRCDGTSLLPIFDTLPSMMRALRMVWIISRHYNTEKQMLPLMTLIANEIGAKVQEFVNIEHSLSLMFDQPKKMLDIINEGIATLQKWKTVYFTFRKQVDERNTNEVRWDFDTDKLFGRTEFMKQRLMDLAVVGEGILKYKLFLGPQMTGVGNKKLAESVLVDIKKLVEPFQNFEGIFDMEDVKEWTVLKERHKIQLQLVEKKINDFVTMSFEQLSSSKRAFKLLQDVQKNKDFASLGNVEMLITKKKQILKRFGEEIDDIFSIFEKEKDDPPKTKNMPEVVSKIYWANLLVDKIKITVDVIKKEGKEKVFDETDEGRQIKEKCIRVVQTIKEYADGYFNTWKERFDREGTNCLKKNIFCGDYKNLKDIHVDFDPKLNQLIQETRYMERFFEKKKNISDIAINITLQADKYHELIESLKGMIDNLQTTLSILGKHERIILKPKEKELVEVIKPGFTVLNWNSLGIPAYIKRCNEKIMEFSGIVSKIQKNVKILSGLILQIKKTNLSVNPKELKSKNLELSELFQLFENNKNEKIEYLRKKYKTVTQTLMKIEGELISTNLIASSTKSASNGRVEILHNYYYYIERRILRALLSMVKNSLGSVLQLRKTPGVLKICFSLVNNEIVETPTKDEILVIIDKIMTMIVNSTKCLPRFFKGTCIPITEDKCKIESEKINTDNVPRIISEKYSFHQDVVSTSGHNISKTFFIITQGIQRTTNRIDKLREFYERFSQYWKIPIEPAIKKFQEQKPTCADYEARLEDCQKLISDIDSHSKHNVVVDFINIDLNVLLKSVQKQARKWIESYAASLVSRTKPVLESIEKNIREKNEELDSRIDSIQDLRSVLTTLDEIKESYSDVEREYLRIESIYTTLNTYKVECLEIDEFSRAMNLEGKWMELMRKGRSLEKRIVPLKRKFRQETIEDIIKLKKDIQTLQKKFTKGALVKLLNKEMKECQDELEIIQEKKKEYQISEKLFDLPLTAFPVLSKLTKMIKSVSRMYELQQNFTSLLNNWSKTPFGQIQLETMRQKTRKFLKKLREDYDEEESKMKIHSIVKQKVKDFTDSIPLFASLKSDDLRKRHWDMIMEKTGVTFDIRSDAFTLEKLIEMELFKFSDILEEIFIDAKKEVNIENLLRTVSESWRNRRFTFVEHVREGKSRGKIIGGKTEILEALEEDSTSLAGVGGTRHTLPFAEEISKFEKVLTKIEEGLNLWIDTQRMWINLEVIFIGSQDIRQQLKRQAQAFDKIEAEWQKIMGEVAKVKNIKECVFVEGRIDLLKRLYQGLQTCQKGLRNYLQTKRNAFPRFFYLSDEELLSVLGKSDIENVQKQVTKMFNNAASLIVKKNSTSVIGMLSNEGEEFFFKNQIQPTNVVEKWLYEVEKEMKSSMHHICKEAVFHYPKKKRIEWIQENYGQVGLVGSQIWWTWEVENSFEEVNNGEKMAVKNLSKKLTLQIKDLVTKIRTKLSKQDRKKIFTLIIIDVHARDIVDTLVRDSILDKREFEWESQLRFYWDKKRDTILIRQCTGEFDYGMEYQGLNGRLVITPLTDRCFMTLTQALTFHLGGNPAGPAGTGKTESVKDLAKSMGNLCIVFNCSEGLNYQAMSRIFSGLCQNGAWGCFDEFNRIELPVLSVVSTQIRTIQDALSKHQKTFRFDEQDIKLDNKTGVFVTMNPGYAGRVELPDNLKALFRPITMCVPDSDIICEIMLFSQGFENARRLSRKMIKLYSLAKGQLSKQRFYDWGLRALKAILNKAGELKRMKPEEPEDGLLMKAIYDMNIAKFVYEDVPLFEDLLRDLFVEMKIDKTTSKVFQNAIEQELREQGYKIMENGFQVSKVVQLYETMNSRHSTMVIGGTTGGKTVVIKTLVSTQTKLGFKTKLFLINPKAQTCADLYGDMDEDTREWTDGVLSSIFRKINIPTENPNDRRYLFFDGDVDTVWIESMNSVMDDNKWFTMAHGERIQLIDQCKLLFEVGDLHHASPATVSRCGMVFVDPKNLGIDTVIWSWLERKFSEEESTKKIMQKLFTDYCDKTIDVILEGSSSKNPLGTIIPQTKINLINQMCNILEFLFLEIEKERSEDVLKSVFCFALVWGIGGSVTGEKRAEFDEYFRSILEMREVNNREEEKEVPAGTIPSVGTLYEYYFDTKLMCWKRWENLVKKYEPPSDGKYSSILVPTIDTVRYNYFLKNLLDNKHPVLFVGIPGTSKSVIIKTHLSNRMKEDNTQGLLKFYFSGRTSSLDVQRALEDRIERKGGCYAPKGCNTLNVFIDELNMPNVDVYGTQQPIAFLKCLIENNGFYERGVQSSTINWLKLKNINYVGSFCPASIGRNPVDTRFVSLFNLFCLQFPSDYCLRKIFFSILEKHLESFNQPIREACGKVTDSTLTLYKFILEKLPPTPSKFHYVFNLRDISRVFEGLCASTIDCFESDHSFVRLWRNECKRVFVDRLINKKDIKLIQSKIDELVKKDFESDHNSITKEPSLFGDYNVNFKTKNVVRLYQDMEDYSVIRPIVEDKLEEYNEFAKKPLNIVLFDKALEHLSRIHRIIRIEGGHAMLIGVGGSGKKSLVKLATHLAGYELFTLNLSRGYSEFEFKEDMKLLFNKLGVEDKKITFMFQDTDIIDENFLEHINNLLTSGYLPALFESEEKDQVIASVTDRAKKDGVVATKDNIWKYFLSICKDNLHVVLTMSPNEELKKRCRNFPGLINCATIDWFFEWPRQALYSVAKRYLQEGDETFENLEDIVNHMIMVHLSVVKRSKLFLKEKRRYNHVTPKNYLDFLSTFKKVLKRKRKECDDDINKYTGGVNILEKTKEDVTRMQETLKETMIVVEKKQVQVNKLLSKIAKNTTKAEKEKAISEENKKKLEVQTVEITKLKIKAQSLLDKAEPLVKRAEKAVEKLERNNITIMKSFKQPHKYIQSVGSCVVILFEGASDKTPGWNDAQRIFSDTSFISKILSFEKEKVNNKMVKKIRSIIKEIGSDFTIDNITKISPSAGGIFTWVDAVVNYHATIKKIKPLREQLERHTKELEKSKKELQRTAKTIQGLEDLLTKLSKSLEKNQKEEKVLKERAEKMRNKLSAAQKIISGLSEEKIRWEQLMVELKKQRVLLLGDCLIASGFLSYLASFTVDYRNHLMMEIWEKDLIERKIPRNIGKKVIDILSNEVEMAQWESEGLPSDEASIQNGVFTSYGSKFSICIDPQNQALKWIKQKTGKKDLEVRTFHSSGFFKKLETSLKFGKKFLFERVDEFIDPIIDPVLNIDVTTGNRKVKFGEDEIDVDDDFCMYICTNLSNPRYTPEIQGSTLVVNYSVTFNGLKEQLLNEVVKNERPELEKARKDLIKETSSHKTTLSQLENKILLELNLAGSSGQSLIDNEEVIAMLDEIKSKVMEINKKLVTGIQTNKDIKEASEVYKKVAERGAILYFVINGLGNINPMYEYSLDCFLEQIFVFSLKKSEYSNIFSTRLNNIIEYLTKRTYTYVCSGLFEKDKLTFSLLMAVKILKIQEKELEFFMKGNVSLEGVGERNPFPWLKDKKKWKDMNLLTQLDAKFKNIIGDIKSNEDEWIKWYNIENAEAVDYPDGYSEILSDFQKLCLLRCFRIDRILKAVSNFITAALGSDFYVKAPILDYKRIYRESTNVSPLLCLISPGFDPANEIIQLSRRLKEKCISISLGQGQGEKAAEAIKRSFQKGYWVLLQNCHLLIDWMKELEKLLDVEKENVHKKFRLWMTSEVANFPISILQKSLKIVTEPPNNLKLNMVSSYSSLMATSSENQTNETDEHHAYKSLVFVITYFHAVILERKKYGKIGWNVQYDFNNSDYSVSLKLLKLYLQKSLEFGEGKIPWSSLKYLIGEAMYGGRVTDDFDRRVLITYLNEYMGDFLFDKFQKFLFSDVNKYELPPVMPNDKLYLEYIEKKVQFENSPQVVGLHSNAEITYLTNRTRSLWTKLLQLQGGSSGSTKLGLEQEKEIIKITDNILKLVPKEYIFNRDIIKKEIGELPNPIQVVLLQELEIFNKLLLVIRNTLKNLKRALLGEIRMSNDLEILGFSLYNGKVPECWLKYAPKSKKGLSSWLKHLQRRYDQYKDWVDTGEDPIVIWLSGLHIPESFLTSIVQVCCKKKKIPLDKTVLFTNMTRYESPQEITSKPPFGCYVKGLFLEGAKWDQEKKCLVEAEKKVLIQELPVMKVIPIEVSKLKLQNTFKTPVYYTTDRGNAAGEGKCFEANMKTFDHDSHWILKGVAISLNDDD